MTRRDNQRKEDHLRATPKAAILNPLRHTITVQIDAQFSSRLSRYRQAVAPVVAGHRTRERRVLPEIDCCRTTMHCIAPGKQTQNAFIESFVSGASAPWFRPKGISGMPPCN